MKKALITLFVTAELAFSAQAITLSTDFSKGSNAGNGYGGITFTITGDTDRYISDESIISDTSYTLESISVQFRNDSGNNKIADGLAMVVTDNNGAILGISDTASAFETLTISNTSCINTVTVNFGTSPTLSTDIQYFAYYVASSGLSSLSIGGTLTADSIANVNLMARGTGYSDPSGDFGLTSQSIGNTTSDNYTPVGVITLSLSVPEPTTASLSLLALGVLTLRRHRK